MENEIPVQFLMYLNVIIHNDNKDKLLLIEAGGYSGKAQLGVPRLVQTNCQTTDTENGLLELDFVVMPVEDSKKKSLTWNVQTVYNMAELPDNLKGVKVKAANNADIVLINV